MSYLGTTLDLGRTGKHTPVYTSPQNADPDQEKRFGTSAMVTLKENTPRDMLEKGKKSMIARPVEDEEVSYLKVSKQQRERMKRDFTHGEIVSMLRHDGEYASMKKVGKTKGEEEIDMYLGSPIKKSELSSKYTIERSEVQVSSEAIKKVTGDEVVEGDISFQFALGVALAIAIVVCLAVILHGYFNYQKVKQKQKTKRERLKLERYRDEALFHLSSVKDSTKTDINGDGKPDIQTTVQGDGTTTQIPLNKVGEKYLGTNEPVVTESGMTGKEVADYFEETQGDLPGGKGGIDMKWILAIAGVGGAIGIALLLKKSKYRMPSTSYVRERLPSIRR